MRGRSSEIVIDKPLLNAIGWGVKTTLNYLLEWLWVYDNGSQKEIGANNNEILLLDVVGRPYAEKHLAPHTWKKSIVPKGNELAVSQNKIVDFKAFQKRRLYKEKIQEFGHKAGNIIQAALEVKLQCGQDLRLNNYRILQSGHANCYFSPVTEWATWNWLEIQIYKPRRQILYFVDINDPSSQYTSSFAATYQQTSGERLTYDGESSNCDQVSEKIMPFRKGLRKEGIFSRYQALGNVGREMVMEWSNKALEILPA